MPDTNTAEMEGLEGFEEMTEQPSSPETDTKPEDKEKKPAEDPAVRELRRLLKDERKARKDAEEGVRYWHEQAKGGKPGAKADEEEEEAPKLSVDLVDALTNGDAKQIKKALRELGFVESKDVDHKIGTTRAQMTEEARLYGRYPDLQDEESELYQETRAIYLDLAKDPSMAKSPKLVETAAKMAARILGQEEKKPSRRAVAREAADEDDDYEEREQERVRRVARQSGDRGRQPKRDDRQDSTELSGTQKSIVQKFRDAGADFLTDEAYAKRAQRGIRMSGVPTRRRG